MLGVIIKKTEMKDLYFYINGSGSPFWLEEHKDIYGNIYFSNLFWPQNPSKEFEKTWKSISIIFDSYRNPIDGQFPSFWTQSMCNLFNENVQNLLSLSKIELKNFNIINKFIPIIRDMRLPEYSLDPLKYHLGLNKNFNNKEAFEEYLKNKIETESLQIIDLPFEKNFRISQTEYYAYNRICLNFGNFKNFTISFCPFTNRTYITDINIGGHFAIYLASRIQREDILNNAEKIIRLSETLIK